MNNVATEIKKVHKAMKSGRGVIVAPLSEQAKEILRDEGLKIGNAETPCGATGHNTVTR